jgi:rfaE bifunctional protein kinase chain/domain
MSIFAESSLMNLLPIERFPELRILVIGEAILDRYLYGCATRFCQETPTPVVTLSGCENQPGGAANTAVNVRSLGAQVTLCSVVGNDEEGKILQEILIEHGIDTSQLWIAADRSTLTKQRVLDDDRLLLRFDHGSVNAIAPQFEQAIIHHLAESNYDAVIVSDYGYGVMTDRVIDAIAQTKCLIVDAKDLTRYQFVNATAVKPNYQQVLNLLNGIETENVCREEWITVQAPELFLATGAQMIAVTLDREGVILLQRDEAPHRIYANPACPTRTIGAGDTFTAAMAVALATNTPPKIAAEFAAAAAAIVVEKSGTAICTLDELIAHFQLSIA